MTSYINKKQRLFRAAGDNELLKKRSDARMKTYDSCTDNRAWKIEDEERRQHILELVKQRTKKV